MRTKTLLLLLVLLAVLAGGYVAWWFYLARTVEQQIAAWIADQRAQASFIEYSSLEVGGFPFAVRATATDFSIRRPDGVEWKGPRLEAQAAPWRINAVGFTLTGGETLAVPAAGARPALAVASHGTGTGHADFALASGALTRAVLNLADVTVAPAAAGDAAAQTARIGALDVTAEQPPQPPAQHTEPGLTVTVTARDVALPPVAAAPLGQAVQSLGLDARVMGALPRSLDPSAVAAWSSAGGTVEVDRLALAWGPLAATANGTVALDKQLQPMGALLAEVAGFDETVDALVTAGQVRAKDAAFAKAALNLLSRKDNKGDKGGRPVIQASLSAQNGWLFFGPAKLVRLPELPWP